MNLGELRDAVKNRLGLSPQGDALITDAFVDSAINSALRAVSSEKPWWWLLASVTFDFNGGQAALPSDAMSIEGIQAYGGLLDAVSRRDMLDQDSLDPQPSGWTVLGNVLWLVPAPEGLVPARMLYYRAEATLVADTDEPLIPLAYQDKVVAYAAYLGYKKRQDPVRAAAEFTDYKDWVARTQADQSPVKGPRRARVARRRAVVGASGATLPAQPPITVGGVIDCTSTTRPLEVDGQLIFETDKRRLLQYEAALADWVPPRGVGFTAPTASPPAHAYDGEIWFRGDTRLAYVWDSGAGAWRVLRGLVLPCTHATQPAGQYEGQAIYETDTDKFLVYASAGTGFAPPWNISWGYLGEAAGAGTAQNGIAAATTTDITNGSVTWTAIANRRYKLSAGIAYTQRTSGGTVTCRLRDSAGTTIAFSQTTEAAANTQGHHSFTKTVTPGAGSKTYKLSIDTTAGTIDVVSPGGALVTTYLVVEDIGPAGAPA